MECQNGKFLKNLGGLSKKRVRFREDGESAAISGDSVDARPPIRKKMRGKINNKNDNFIFRGK